MEERKVFLGLVATEFPKDIKKGDIINMPNGKIFKVLKTPAQIGSRSCYVKDIITGEKYWQFPFVGLIVNGKPLQ